ncbi:MAG: FtsX-like permease family protein, partial [Deltaproteobacteria bacterium]
MRLTCSLRMPLRFARHSAGGMALTIVAIGCGVALVCAIDLANRAVLRAFVEIVDTMAGRAALEVAAGEGGLFPEDVAARVGSVPGVELALPVVKAMAFTLDGSGESLTVHGVDLTDKAAEGVYGAKLELDDPLVLLSHADSVVLSRAFAASRSLASNDRIDLMTPAGRRSFTIRGLLEPAGVARAYGGNVALMDLYGAEALFTRAGFINGVDVVVKRDADVTRVAEAIARVLPEGLRVETPVQRQADLQRVMQSLRVALDAMGLFGLVAAFLIAFNRLSTVFEARSWQLGVLRAVGVRRRIVWRELLKESAVLGTAGVVFGIPLGIGLGRLLLPVIATTATLAYNLVAPRAELAVHPSSLALATALGLGSPVLAAALPAWRASRVALAATIRSRGVEQPGGSKASMWLVRAATAVAIGMAMAAQSSTRSATAGLLATGLIAVGTALAAR